MKNLPKIILCIFLCQLAGLIGSFVTIPAIATWYLYLQKPPLNPPGFIFGPVWLALYTLMGISLYLIWQSTTKQKLIKGALTFFAIQLVLNALWSPLFFGSHQLFIALVDIIFMWIFILLTIIKFRPISKTAAYLLIPYLIWVTFATYLNLEIWILNP